MNIWRRTGGFLIALGIVLIALYLVSDAAQAGVCQLLAWGAGATVLGSLLIWLNPKPEQDSGRFSAIRKRRADREVKKGQRKK